MPRRSGGHTPDKRFGTRKSDYTKLLTTTTVLRRVTHSTSCMSTNWSTLIDGYSHIVLR